MGIKVLLSDGRKPEDVTFHPGDIIRGKVIYQLTKPKTIDRAVVNFKGLIKTEFIPLQTGGNTQLVTGPRRPSREKSRLFEQEVILFQGPYKVPAQTFEWLFEVLLPRTCSREGPQREPGPITIPGMPDNGAEVDLPPSYKWRDMAIGRDASCEISYTLSIAVESGGRLENLVSGENHELSLTVRQPQSSHLQSTDLKPTAYKMTPVSWKSGQLRPAERRLSFKDKMKSVVSKDPALKSPCLAFTLSVHVPRSLDVNQRFPIGFSVKHERKTDLDPEEPTLEVSGFTMTLHYKTTIIVGQSGLFSPERNAVGGLPIASHKVQFPTNLGLPLDGEVVFTAEKFCLADWLGQAAVNDSQALYSDFAIWVVKLTHQLGLDVTVLHKETEKDFKMGIVVPLQLQHSTNAIVLDQSGEGSTRDEDNLPRYEDDTKPPPDCFSEGRKE